MSKVTKKAKTANEEKVAKSVKKAKTVIKVAKVAKVAKNSPGKRGRKPAVKYPYVFDFRRPCDPKSEIELGKAFYEEGKTPPPNAGMVSAKEFKELLAAKSKAEFTGVDIPSIPVMYSFIRRGIAARRNATVVITGHQSKGSQPSESHNIPKSIMANYSDRDRVHVDANGKPIPLRAHHKNDARNLVIDKDENVLTIGKWNYVVGTSDTPAAFLINASKTGGYAAAIVSGKAAAFAGQENILGSLCGRFINDWKIVTLDDGTEPGGQEAVGPNMLIDAWGYFRRGNKRMTPVQIRKAVKSGDVKDISFESVYTPGGEQLRSKVALNRTSFLAAIKSRMSNVDEKRMNNIWTSFSTVQVRTSMNEMHPYGALSMQTGIIPVSHYGEDCTTLLVSFVLGAWIGTEYSENSRQAHYRLHPEEYEDYEEPESEGQSDEEAAPVGKGEEQPVKQLVGSATS